jgi:hypothetical protein
MTDRTIDWDAVAMEIRNGELSNDKNLWNAKEFKNIMPAQAIFILRDLLRDFGIQDECIIATCEEAMNTDSVEWALFDQLKYACGDKVSNFEEFIPDLFNWALWNCRGFRTGLKFSDKDVEQFLNVDRMLGKYGLRVTFSPHRSSDPFEIALYDNKSGTLIDRATFEYNNSDIYNDQKKFQFSHWFGAKHDMHDLINVINRMIKPIGFILLDANDASDSYVFVLLETQEYVRLEEKYGDPSRLINLDNALRYLRSVPDVMDPKIAGEWESLRKDIDGPGERLRQK